MEVYFFNNVEFASPLFIMSDSQSDNEEISKEYLTVLEQNRPVLNQRKNKKLHFDSSEEEYYYSSEEINSYLRHRFNSRINYFKNFKRKNKINFNNEADELFIKFLEFMYYKNSINLIS